MKYLSIILFFLLIPFSSNGHDFKLSISEVVFDTNTKKCEVRFYLYEDDLQEALYHQSGKEITIKNEDVVAYLNKHFKLNINGKMPPLELVSMKKKDKDLLQFTFQINFSGKQSTINKVEIQNDIMIEKFKKQTNMVYLKIKGKPKQIASLNKNKKVYIFKL